MARCLKCGTIILMDDLSFGTIEGLDKPVPPPYCRRCAPSAWQERAEEAEKIKEHEEREARLK